MTSGPDEKASENMMAFSYSQSYISLWKRKIATPDEWRKRSSQ